VAETPFLLAQLQFLLLVVDEVLFVAISVLQRVVLVVEQTLVLVLVLETLVDILRLKATEEATPATDGWAQAVVVQRQLVLTTRMAQAEQGQQMTTGLVLQ
jgi:type IV secretory pathway TrbL component